MTPIPSELEFLFTFTCSDDPMAWSGEYRPGSLQPDEDIPTVLDRLPAWESVDYEADEMPAIWGNDQRLALLIIDFEGGLVELRLSPSREAYEDFKRYLPRSLEVL